MLEKLIFSRDLGYFKVKFWFFVIIVVIDIFCLIRVVENYRIFSVLRIYYLLGN